jgi:hypothetical protein
MLKNGVVNRHILLVEIPERERLHKEMTEFQESKKGALKSIEPLQI